jgi:8-amino-7-oxononanoate synthase
MLTSRFEQELCTRLQNIAAKGQRRNLTPLHWASSTHVLHQERSYLNLSGNDYLGLSGDRELLAAFYRERTDRDMEYAVGSGGSRLMTGNRRPYDELEHSLSALYGSRVLCFNSGYHANIGILPALTTRNDLILADKYCHASLIDGMRLSRAEIIRYPHRAHQRLEQLLAQKRDQFEQVFIVTESIFSMGGDVDNLHELVRLKKEYDCCLYVDEAHGVGAVGQGGLGIAELQGVRGEIDLLLGTFGKAWAGQGAFVVCSDTVADFLINSARSLIFTTGLPPVVLSWLLFLSGRIRAMEQERDHLAALSRQLRQALRQEGLTTDGTSHIVPVHIGESETAERVALSLREQGYWVTAIRPPTVPAGTARLRLSLCTAMTWNDLKELPGAITNAMAS